MRHRCMGRPGYCPILAFVDARIAAWTKPRSDVEAAYEEQCLAEEAALSRGALAFLDRLPPEERHRLRFQQGA